jgi:hypothetical protein
MLCSHCHQREVTVTHFAPNAAAPTKPLIDAVCAECASELYGTPLPAHRFVEHFDISDDCILRISFTGGDVFRLSGFGTVDPSIYGDTDRWTATVVEAVRGAHHDFARLYRPGSGLDFNESDITEIFNESSSTILFRSHNVA